MFPFFWQHNPGFEKMKTDIMKGIKPHFPPDSTVSYVNQAGFKDFNKEKNI